jgi:hypothetical protein
VTRIIFRQRHEITSLSLPSGGSIDVRAEIHAPLNGGPDSMAVLFFCPYCWAKCLFVEEVRKNGIGVTCEQVQSEFGVVFE